MADSPTDPDNPKEEDLVFTIKLYRNRGADGERISPTLYCERSFGEVWNRSEVEIAMAMILEQVKNIVVYLSQAEHVDSVTAVHHPSPPPTPQPKAQIDIDTLYR